MSVVLIGYRGSGKSSIGHKLADRLWQKCIDTDDLIVAKAGKSIAQIFTDHGEPYFRDLETEVVKEVSAIQDHVIALGGDARGEPSGHQGRRTSRNLSQVRARRAIQTSQRRP